MTPLRFAAYEVHPVKDYGDEAVICSDEEAHFWSVYGILNHANSGRREYVCIGDFSCKDEAYVVAELISG